MSLRPVILTSEQKTEYVCTICKDNFEDAQNIPLEHEGAHKTSVLHKDCAEFWAETQANAGRIPTCAVCQQIVTLICNKSYMLSEEVLLTKIQEAAEEGGIDRLLQMIYINIPKYTLDVDASRETIELTITSVPMQDSPVFTKRIMTAFMSAAAHDKVRVLDALLTDPEAVLTHQAYINARGDAALCAMKNDKLAALKRLLQDGPIPYDNRIKAISYAVSIKNLEAVKLLIMPTTIPTQTPDPAHAVKAYLYHRTACHIAKNDPSILTPLLSDPPTSLATLIEQVGINGHGLETLTHGDRAELYRIEREATNPALRKAILNSGPLSEEDLLSNIKQDAGEATKQDEIDHLLQMIHYAIQNPTDPLFEARIKAALNEAATFNNVAVLDALLKELQTASISQLYTKLRESTIETAIRQGKKEALECLLQGEPISQIQLDKAVASATTRVCLVFMYDTGYALNFDLNTESGLYSEFALNLEILQVLLAHGEISSIQRGASIHLILGHRVRPNTSGLHQELLRTLLQTGPISLDDRAIAIRSAVKSNNLASVFALIIPPKIAGKNANSLEMEIYMRFAFQASLRSGNQNESPIKAQLEALLLDPNPLIFDINTKLLSSKKEEDIAFINGLKESILRAFSSNRQSIDVFSIEEIDLATLTAEERWIYTMQLLANNDFSLFQAVFKRSTFSAKEKNILFKKSVQAKRFDFALEILSSGYIEEYLLSDALCQATKNRDLELVRKLLKDAHSSPIGAIESFKIAAKNGDLEIAKVISKKGDYDYHTFVPLYGLYMATVALNHGRYLTSAIVLRDTVNHFAYKTFTNFIDSLE